MAEKNHIEQALKQAKRTVLWSSFLLFLGFFLAIQLTYFPNSFHSNDMYISDLDSSTMDTYPIATNLDPSDIENGIHIPTGLIVDDGVDQVISTCGACHSLDLVTQNRADYDGWKNLIVWMQETQGLWDLGVNEEIILTYLAKNYQPEDTGRRKKLEDIVWYAL